MKLALVLCLVSGSAGLRLGLLKPSRHLTAAAAVAVTASPVAALDSSSILLADEAGFNPLFAVAAAVRSHRAASIRHACMHAARDPLRPARPIVHRTTRKRRSPWSPLRPSISSRAMRRPR